MHDHSYARGQVGDRWRWVDVIIAISILGPIESAEDIANSFSGWDKILMSACIASLSVAAHCRYLMLVNRFLMAILLLQGF